jgi:hypothetical protein
MTNSLLEEALLKENASKIDKFIVLDLSLSLPPDPIELENLQSDGLQPSFSLSSTTISNQNSTISYSPRRKHRKPSPSCSSPNYFPPPPSLTLVTAITTITNTCDHAMSVTFTPNGVGNTRD